MLEFIIDNIGVLIGIVIVFLGLVVRFTPSKKDNSILNVFKCVIDFILPKFKKGGLRNK